MLPSLFITGTDTGVGKTLVSCALLHAYVNAGVRALGMKPVAAGAQMRQGAWWNEDVAALREAGNVEAAADLVNPYCFEPPIAPHIAAERAGVAVDLDRIAAAHAELSRLAQRTVVEGAGGFCVPLGPAADMSHVAQRLGLAVVLVVGMRLGCLNHALLTANAVRASGVRLAGWVANHIDAGMMFPADNVKALEARLAAPLIVRIPYIAQPSAARIARDIDLALLERDAS